VNVEAAEVVLWQAVDRRLGTGVVSREAAEIVLCQPVDRG